ncbi:MAG: proteasome activator [Acidimicrobiales bacterium]|nr:proteasome activator [Acidimicrobiales bacterium]
MSDAAEPSVSEPSASEPSDPEPDVSDPAKLIRLGTMLQTLMVEVRDATTDEESRQMLARIHAETMEELGTVLSSDLMDELTEFVACCDDQGVPTEAEIRVAQAQLVGWLQGLLQGLQASMAAQQAAAQQQLQMLAARRPGGRPPSPAGKAPGLPEHTGNYL